MLLFFLTTLAFSLVFFIVAEEAKKLYARRRESYYLHKLVNSKFAKKPEKIQDSTQLSKRLSARFSATPLHRFLSYLRQTYDVPKDINAGNLLFIQVGLLFICWNVSGFLKISLFPLLFLAALTESVGAFLLLSRHRLLDQLDKAFPQLLDALASMYHIHPDLKHSFVSSKELVTDIISQRFLTELTQLTQLGLPTVQSLQLMAERWQYPPLSFLISSIQVHQSTGGNLAQLFRQTASSLRRHQQNTKAMQSVMFQNKISGFVVCALVPVILLLSISLSANYRSVIFGEPLARSLVIAAGVWWSIGVVVMWKALRVRV